MKSRVEKERQAPAIKEGEWNNAKMDRFLMTKIIVFAITLFFLFPKPKKIIGQYYNIIINVNKSAAKYTFRNKQI